MKKLVVGAVAATILTAGCAVKQPPPDQSPQAKPYVIGMGDIMLTNQLHHSKLWFAGTAGNWPLAKYELGELHGGFARVATYHPTFKKKPTGPLVDEFVKNPFGELAKAVADKSEPEFTTGYDDLTSGCNGCHKELGYDFNVLKRPTAPPFTDQDYAPVKPG
ncbi:MAG TPA: hypothetical protein VIC34_15170 [Croceibacterium sp.]|jgi:hypothetical protein